MSWLDSEAHERKIVRRLCAIARGDALLVERFGIENIVRHPMGALASKNGPITNVPTLAFSREPFADARQLGDAAVARFEIAACGYFHPEEPPDPNVTEPDPPTLGATGAGILTGSFRWAIAIMTARGDGLVQSIQGLVQVSAQADLTDESITLEGLPTDVTVLLYRTPAMATGINITPRLRAVLVNNQSASFVDGDLDDPGAPDEMLGEEELSVEDSASRTMEFVKMRIQLHTSRGITNDAGAVISRAVTNLREGAPFYDSTRNLWCAPLFTLYDSRIGIINREGR
jgi:hypothetical protein